MSEVREKAAAPKAPAASAPVPVDLGVLAALLASFAAGAAALLQSAAARAALDQLGKSGATLAAIGGAFPAGLAAGLLLLGSRADRAARPLKAFALAVGVASGGGFAALLLPGIVGVAVALVPAAALGAALPLLARARASGRGRGAAVGGLLGAAALGAAGGAFAGPALLLGSLGTRGTWALAAAVSGLVAAAAWLLSRGESGDAEESERGEAMPATTPTAALVLASLLSGAAFVALSMLLERGLAPIARPSRDSLGTMLAAFLAASALGAGIGAVLAKGRERARGGFALAQALAVVAPLLAIVLLRAAERAPDASFLRLGESATSWSGRLLREFLGALVIAGPAAAALALGFPCSCELARGARLGGVVARLAGAAALGGALAGVATPTLLVPRVGLRLSLLLVAALPLVAWAIVAVADRALLAPRRLAWIVGGLALAAALLLIPIGGATIADPLLFLHRVAGGERLRVLGVREDALATVAAIERESGGRILAVDDQIAAGSVGAPRVATMEGVLPALLHPKPRKALLLGVGTGATVPALLEMGCDAIDAVAPHESLPSLLPAFAAENRAAVLDPRVRLVVADPRAFVRSAAEASYDLVIADLVAPWDAEAGLSLSRDHFERAKRLLAPDGLFCQWLPGHRLRWEELGLVGRTFADVFEGATVWLARPDDPFPVLGLVAGAERLELDVSKLAARLEKHPAKARLESLGVADAKEFLALYVADEWFFRDKFDDDSIDTSDRARVEFLAARRVESDAVVALHNRRRLFEQHEDVVYRMTQGATDRKELPALKRELSAAARAMWQLYDAKTDLLLAQANRELPPEARLNAPEELEAKAFQAVGALMRDRPGDAAARETMRTLLGELVRRRDYAPVIDGVAALEKESAIGVDATLRYLRGLAFLRAVCDPDPAKAAAITKPLDFAVKDFRKAVDLDPGMVEAKLHLATALFLSGTKESWAEAKDLLETTRAKISAPDRPGGHGLPAPQEAILSFLQERKDEAQQWLSRPESRWAAARLAERMQKGATAER
jgi:spermidine synthase